MHFFFFFAYGTETMTQYLLRSVQESKEGGKKTQLPGDNDCVHSMLIELQYSGDQTLAYTVGKLFT